MNLRGNAQTVSISLDKCTGDGSEKYILKDELINNMQGSTDPYINGDGFFGTAGTVSQ